MISRLAYGKGSWGGTSEILLEELRLRGVFERSFVSEGSSNKNDASPYWYGTVLNYFSLQKNMPYIKKEKLREIVEIYISDLHSPIIRLLGLTLKRTYFSEENS